MLTTALGEKMSFQFAEYALFDARAAAKDIPLRIGLAILEVFQRRTCSQQKHIGSD
jgi:hypothetical protein